MRLATGWIAPDGTYIDCWPWDHDMAILQFLLDRGNKKPSVSIAEKLGYIRVTGKPSCPFTNDDNPTERQLDTIFDYHMKFTKKL